MRIERLRPAQLSSVSADTVIVIDVLRMTSTAAVLMRRDARDGIAVAATLEDFARLPKPASEYVVVSELVGAPRAGAWVDNSPAQVSRTTFGQRTPVLFTTNGTRALFAAASSADEVLLASFRDLRAVAQHVVARAPRSVVLSPAGDFARGEGRVEDDLCADALELLLSGGEPDLASCAEVIRADPRVARRAATEPGFAADLDMALEADAQARALRFRPIDAGVGHISWA
jgi:phosphosulfolactate phosphohydrolase-like enzyme